MVHRKRADDMPRSVWGLDVRVFAVIVYVAVIATLAFLVNLHNSGVL